MADEGYRRKLTAILGADVKGYGRMMDRDEEATLRTLTSHRTAFATLVERYRGRVVDTPGDYVLAEFPSVVDSVDCAVEIQREIAERNEELPDERKMEFRIGINLGDVIEKDGKIYGDGVNIAARMEPLADAGGICITGRVYDQVANILDREYQYLGEHEVKNVSMPIRVYKVLSHPGAAAHRVVQAKWAASRQRRYKTFGATMVALVALVGLVLWQVYEYSNKEEPDSVENMALPLPDKPSIAVLPFDNMSDDPQQEHIADGISEDIITALSKTPKMFVIARNSSFTYKDKPVDITEVGKKFGVRYVLEGSVRRSEDDIRINAQLIDAQTGHHVWAEKYDLKMTAIFDLQDEITHEILTALQVELTEGEQERVYLRGTSNLEAYFKVIEARELIRHFNVEENKKAQQLLNETVALEPNYAQAYRWLGSSHAMDVWLGVSKSPKDSLEKSIEFYKKAISLDETMGEAYGSMGFIYVLRKQYEEGLEAMEKGVELSPNGADTHMYLGGGLLYADRLDEAILISEKGIRLNPLAPSWYLNNLSAMYRSKGEFEEALKWSEQAVAQEPQNVISQVNLTSIYALLDRMDEARQSAEEVTKLNPKFSLNRLEKTLPYKNPEVKKQYIGALQKAGLPYSEEKDGLPLPDKPSIAVLPFDNMSDDPNQEYFSDGITEDIITALSKTPKMFVIARNSTFTYKGKPADVKEVGKKFGVRYVLEGSVRKSGEDIRINAQLIDAQTGHHLWAEKYDRDLGDIFALQDEITKKIITELQVELTEGEQARIYGRGTDNLDAYLTFLKAKSLIMQLNPEDQHRAKQLLEESIEIDPHFAPAYRWLGASHFADVFIGTSKSKKESLETATELAKKAISLDASYGDAYGLLGFMYVLKRQYDQAIPVLEKALELDPNGADTNNYLAMSYLYLDDLEIALSFEKTAMRLNPIAPSMYLNIMAAIYRSQGKYSEALLWAQRAVDEAPKHTISRVNYCSILILNGQTEEARVQADKVKELNPKFSVAKLENTLPYKNPEVKKIYVDALRKAGLPE